jgi:hypothetical protein
MAKLLPITLRAASLTLTGSLATVVGTVSTDCANSSSGAAKLGFTTSAFVRVSYTRHASSTTGRPIIAIDVSMDDPSTAAASVANWQTVQLMDGASFSSGAVELYAEQQRLNPTAAGTTIFGTHLVNVEGAHWIRVRIADVDSTNLGAVTAVTLGGEA